MNMLKTTAAAAVAMVLSAGGALAIPLYADGGDTQVFVLTNANDPITIDYTVEEDLRLSFISLGASATRGADLNKVEFGLLPSPPNPAFDFSVVGPTNPDSTERDFSTLTPIDLEEGFAFSLFFRVKEGETLSPLGVGFTLSLVTAQVPVPAALPMMAGGLALLGFAGRKLKKAA